MSLRDEILSQYGVKAATPPPTSAPNKTVTSKQKTLRDEILEQYNTPSTTTVVKQPKIKEVAPKGIDQSLYSQLRERGNTKEQIVASLQPKLDQSVTRKKGVVDFVARTGASVLRMATEAVDFAADYVGKKPLELMTKINPAFSSNKPLQDFAQKADEKISNVYNKTTGKVTESLKTGVQTATEDIVKVSPEWENLPLKEKMTKRLPETLYYLAPDVVSSMIPYIINPTLGFGIAAGSTAEDVKQKALKEGMDERKASNIAMITGVAVGLIDRIVPEEVLSKPVRDKFASAFVKRIIKTGAKEAGTEVAQEDLQIIAEKTFREDLGWDEVKTRNAMSGLGGLFGGVGLQTAVGGAQALQTKLDEKVKGNVPPTTLNTKKEEEAIETPAAAPVKQEEVAGEFEQKIITAQETARAPVSQETIERIKAFSEEETAAFGRRIVDDLNSKLGTELKDNEVKLSDDTLIKETRSGDGRPAGINQNNQVEIYLPNLVEDLQSLMEGKKILAHEGEYSSVFKMEEGESPSALAVRYINEVLLHEKAHVKTITIEDQTQQRQLQQAVYAAQASKNQKKIIEAKTALDKFMRGLEDKANAYLKSNRAELEKEIFNGKTVDVKDLTNKSALTARAVAEKTEAAVQARIKNALNEWKNDSVWGKTIKPNAQIQEIPIQEIGKKINLGQKDFTEKGVEEWKNKIQNGERPSVLVGMKKNLQKGSIGERPVEPFVLDGHHRLEAYKRLGFKEVPILNNTGINFTKTNEPKIQPRILNASRSGTQTIVNKTTGVTKPSTKVTVTEKQALKMKLRAEVKGSKEGYRAGYATARAVISDKNATVAQMKKELIAYAEAVLPKRLRGKFLRSINSAKTQKNFLDVLMKIQKEANTAERVAVIKMIEKELQGTIVKTQNKFPNPKFAYEAQKTLNRIRANIRGSYSAAQVKIAELIEEYQVKNTAGKQIDEPMSEEILREIELLKMVGIDEMTTKELREVLSNIQTLKLEGRFTLELERFNKEAEVDRAKEKIFEVITGGKKSPRDGMYFVRDNQNKSIVKRIFTSDQRGLESALNVLSKNDKSSKTNQSFLTRAIMSRVNTSFNTENKGEMKWIARVNKMFRDIYNLSTDQQIKDIIAQHQVEVELKGIPNIYGIKKDIIITRGEAIKKYMEWQDETLSQTFEETLEWGAKAREAVFGILTESDKRFADAQLEIYREYYETINEVFKREFGVDLPFNEFYSPITRDIDVRVPESVLQAQENLRYVSARNGSLEQRKRNRIELKFNDATKVLVDHIVKMEHYKAWSENLTFIRKVFADKKIRQAINDFHGKEYLKFIDDFMNDLARGGVDRVKLVEWADRIRANVTKALLGVNWKPAIKQLTGILNYWIEVPTKDFFPGLVDFWKNPIKNAKFLQEQSVGLQERFGEGFERDIKYALRQNIAQQITKSRSISEAFFAFIRAGDKVTVYQGSWAVFLSSYREFSNGKEFNRNSFDQQAVDKAIEQVELVTNRIQESSRLDTLSPLQRGGSLAKLFTMFQSQPNKMYRVILDSLQDLKYGRGSKAEHLKKIALAWYVIPLIYSMVGNLLVPDEYKKSKKRLATEALFGPLTYPLIIGQIVQSVMGSFAGERFAYQATPAESVVADAKSFASSINKAVKDMSIEDFAKGVTYFIDTAGKFGGVPTTLVTNPTRDLFFSKKSKKSSEGIIIK